MVQEINTEQIIEKIKSELKNQRGPSTSSAIPIEIRRQIVDACDSGINKSKFCKKLGISTRNYYTWREQFRSSKIKKTMNHGSKNSPIVEVYDLISSPIPAPTINQNRIEFNLNALGYTLEFRFR